MHKVRIGNTGRIMEIKRTIKDYFKALEIGDYDKIKKLFTPDAVVNSPLYGRMKAKDFYMELFRDTSKSKITLIDLLRSENHLIMAGYIRYEWILKDGTPTTFECVDIFQFTDEGKIKTLSIIYDTAKIRTVFEGMKK